VTVNMRKRSSLILIGMTALALIVILRLWGKNAGTEKSEETSIRPVAIALRQAADRNHVAGAIRPGGQSLCAGVQSIARSDLAIARTCLLTLKAIPAAVPSSFEASPQMRCRSDCPALRSYAEPLN